MHSSKHKPHVSVASSLPGAAGMSAAIRRGKLEISNPIPISPYDLEEPDARFVEGQERLHSSTTSAKPDTWPRASTPPALRDFHPQAGHADLVMNSFNSYNNTNRASAALTSTHQSMSSVPSGSSVRKSGGIKAAFRRMFGSKRRRDTFSTGANDHRSRSEDVLNHSRPTDHRPSRKPSLLFEELIRGRALNSHAPSTVMPEPTQAPDERADPIHSLVDGFSRRNSLPSAVLSCQDIQTLDLALNRDGIESDHKALLRPLRRMPNKKFLDGIKRKSRSADALREVAQSQNTFQAQERRLSDEIKYWRNSIIEDPIPNFNSGSQDVEDEGEVTRSNSSQTPTLRTRRSSRDEPARSELARSEGFDFPGLVIGNSDASVEQRITTVEVKLVDLECAIANLQGYDVAEPVVLGKPPRRRKALQNLSQQRGFSTPTMVPKSSFDSYSSDSSTSKEKQDEMSEHRKSVANTIRPGTAIKSEVPTAAASPPPIPTQTRTEEDIAGLMSMLREEQEARRALENQFKDLQKQINEIRFPTAPRCPPTPGHFSTPTSNPIDSSPVSTKRQTVLPFRMAAPRLPSRNPSSVKENEGDDTDTDDGFLDVYETPTEAREFGFGVDTPRSPPLIGVV